MSKSTTAAETAIAWAARHQRTCIVPLRNLTEPLRELPILAAPHQVRVTIHDTQAHFTYDPTITPP